MLYTIMNVIKSFHKNYIFFIFHKIIITLLLTRNFLINNTINLIFVKYIDYVKKWHLVVIFMKQRNILFKVNAFHVH